MPAAPGPGRRARAPPHRRPRDRRQLELAGRRPPAGRHPLGRQPPAPRRRPARLPPPPALRPARAPPPRPARPHLAPGPTLVRLRPPRPAPVRGRHAHPARTPGHRAPGAGSDHGPHPVGLPAALAPPPPPPPAPPPRPPPPPPAGRGGGGGGGGGGWCGTAPWHSPPLPPSPTGGRGCQADAPPVPEWFGPYQQCGQAKMAVTARLAHVNSYGFCSF